MQLPILNVPIREARLKCAEYRKAVKAHAGAADRALLNAYREILRGERVIDINETMANGGLDADGRPVLAVARADMPFVTAFRNGGTQFLASRERWPSTWDARIAPSRRIVIPARRLAMTTERNCSAIVPTIPPELRPKVGVKAHYILWEADWEDAPADPILLKHLGQSLYKVVAQWDLTELERAVLFDMRMN